MSDQTIEHPKQWLKAQLSNLFRTSFLFGKTVRKRGFADEGKIRRFLFALIAFSGLVPAVYAQEFPPVYVLAENPPEKATACGYSHTAIVAAVKSELRHNRIEIATSEDNTAGTAIMAYINTTAGDVGVPGMCVVRYDFVLTTNEFVTISATNERRFASIVFCRKFGLAYYSQSSIQTNLNNQFRDYISQCITEYLEE